MRRLAVQVKEAARARRAEERDARRRAILAAAKRVYARRGFLAATVDEIAAEARVSVGTIYLYYRSKEDLYASLLFESMAVFTRELGRILSSRRSAQAKLRATWEFFARFRRRHPDAYRIFFLFHEPSFTAAVPAATLRELNRAAGRNFALGAAIVEEGMGAGIYRRGDPRAVVDVLWGMFMGLVHLYETRENLGVRPASLEALHKQAFEWFEAGLRAPRTAARRAADGRA